MIKTVVSDYKSDKTIVNKTDNKLLNIILGFCDYGQDKLGLVQNCSAMFVILNPVLYIYLHTYYILGRGLLGPFRGMDKLKGEAEIVCLPSEKCSFLLE